MLSMGRFGETHIDWNKKKVRKIQKKFKMRVFSSEIDKIVPSFIPTPVIDHALQNVGSGVARPGGTGGGGGPCKFSALRAENPFFWHFSL